MAQVQSGPAKIGSRQGAAGGVGNGWSWGPSPPSQKGGGGGDGEARNDHQGQLPLVATGDATGPTITAAN